MVVNYLAGFPGKTKKFLGQFQRRTTTPDNQNYDTISVFNEFPEEYLSLDIKQPKEIYRPPLKTGLLFHGLGLIFFGGGFTYALSIALAQDVGSYFLLYLLLSIALIIPFPFILFRTYALLRAKYLLERDGIRLRWGLRAEDIPLANIQWIQPASELDQVLSLPFLSMPGAIVGTRNIKSLGDVEFMASRRQGLLLIGTDKNIFAISPVNPLDFVDTFQYLTELGSLSPIQPVSVLPATFIKEFFADRLARIPLLVGFLFNLALIIVVGLIIPTQEIVSLGFDSSQIPHLPGPSETLMLFPVLSVMAFTANILAGMFFFRRSGTKKASYLLLASTPITPIIMLMAIAIMI